MKKCVENREIMRERKNMILGRPQYESEKSKNENNEHKLNVYKQQDDIKHLK